MYMTSSLNKDIKRNKYSLLFVEFLTKETFYKSSRTMKPGPGGGVVREVRPSLGSEA